MNRREMLAGGGAALLGLSTFRLGWTAPTNKKKKQKVLYYTRSQGFEHSVVARHGNSLSHSEKILTEMGKRAGFDVECSQDGRVFDGDLDKYDLIAFYATGDQLKPQPNNRRKTPAMSAAGKQKMLDAVAAGKGFVGFHAANDAFRTAGIDPYIAMLGGEFLTHNQQQKATLRLTSPKFPGVQGLAPANLAFLEEWYAMHKFAKDMHVILLQDTVTMAGPAYQRPPFPSTWARMHQKGRVFYTSLGHREDIWTDPTVQQIMLGGIAWALGNVEADVKPNIQKVAPGANNVPPAPKKKAKR